MEQWLRLLGSGCRQISEVKWTLENPELYSTIIRWSPVFENSRGQAIKEYLKIVFRSRWCLHRSLVENEEELYSNVKQACRADFALFPETGIPMDHEELSVSFVSFLCLSHPCPEAFRTSPCKPCPHTWHTNHNFWKWRLVGEMTTSFTTRLYVDSVDYLSTFAGKMPKEEIPLSNLGSNGYKKLRNKGKTPSNADEEGGYGSTNDDTPLMPDVVDNGFDDEEGYSEGYQSSDSGAKDRKKRKGKKNREGFCKRCFKFWCCCGLLESCRRWAKWKMTNKSIMLWKSLRTSFSFSLL